MDFNTESAEAKDFWNSLSDREQDELAIDYRQELEHHVCPREHIDHMAKLEIYRNYKIRSVESREKECTCRTMQTSSECKISKTCVIPSLKETFEQGEAERETLDKIKFVLPNEAQAIRLLEQYGEWKVEQSQSNTSVMEEALRLLIIASGELAFYRRQERQDPTQLMKDITDFLSTHNNKQ